MCILQAALPAASSRSEGGEKKKRRRGKGEDGEDGGDKLTKPHPLAVAVEVPPREGDAQSKKITLTFSYLPSLQVPSPLPPSYPRERIFRERQNIYWTYDVGP